MIQSKIELIEEVYLSTIDKGGEPPVVLVLDPDDPKVRPACVAAIGTYAVFERIRTARRDGMQPLVIVPVPVDAIAKYSLIAPYTRAVVALCHGAGMLCVIASGLGGSATRTFPAPVRS